MLTSPYVTVAEFKAHPTYLDLDDLVVGDSSATDQDAELANILLMASQWADRLCSGGVDGPFLAGGLHEHREQLRPDRMGRLVFTPRYGFVRRLTSVAYGASPTSMTTLTDMSATWVERADAPTCQVTFPLSSATLGPWTGSLQFGSPVPGYPLYVIAKYVGGYGNTTLTGAVAAAAESLPVAEAAGIEPGDVLRIWEPGKEEAVVVAASYTGGLTGAQAIPLAAATLNAHASGAGVSGLSPDVHLAVINYAAAVLLRPDVASEDPWADAPVQPTTRQADTRKDGSGLVAEAARLLTPLRRAR